MTAADRRAAIIEAEARRFSLMADFLLGRELARAFEEDRDTHPVTIVDPRGRDVILDLPGASQARIYL